MKTITTKAGRIRALLTIAGRKNGLWKSTYRLGLIGLGILALSLLAALLPVAVSFAQTVSFGSATNFPVAAGGWNPYSVAVGDVNGDGKLDLAVANNNGNTLGTVSIFLGNGDGSFGPATNFAAQGGPISVAMGKLNGDNILDLAVANQSSGTVSILIGQGDGSFVPAVNYSVGVSPYSVAIGDLDGDGKADVAVACQGSNIVSILFNTGAGAFSAPTYLAVGTSPQSVALGDLNGDGKLDLAVANTGSHNVSILLNTGSGSFGTATNFAAASGPFAIAIGDLNADSNPDLAIVNDNNTNANVAILLNTGAGAFGAPTYFGSDNQPSSVAISDFNSDGKPDLAVASYFNNGVSILLGTGAGAFGSPANFGAGTGPRSVAVGDFNGDTRPDLAVANYWSNNVSILLNTCSQCTLPTISPVGITRQEGSPSVNSTIANVNDAEDAENALTVKVNGGSNATVNGVTVSGINVDSAGVVTADVVAACGATSASFTLTVSDPGGLSSTATLNVTVTENTAPTLSYPANPGITYGTGLTINPLTGPSDNVSVSSVQVFSITPNVSGITVNSAGVVTVSSTVPANNYAITIRATDNCNESTNASFSLGIVKATPIITWSNPTNIVYGAALSNTQLNATANVAGSFTYSPANGTVLNAGNGQTLSVSFTPTDTANYNNAAKSVTINVLKATPIITWNNPPFVASGSALSATQLNATANVPGTFVYMPPAGTVLPVGNGQTLSVNFTPTDTTNYNNATKNVQISVLNTCGSVVNPATLAQPMLGIPYAQVFSASPAGTYSFSVAAGALPPGLTLVNNAGFYMPQGTPTTPGIYSFTIKASRAGSTCETFRNYTLTIAASVVPIAECITNNGNGTYTARFGYDNSTGGVVTIPVGANNYFTPNPQNRGQVTVFQVGRVTNAFSVIFASNGSNTAGWFVKGTDGVLRGVVLTPASPICP